MILPYGKKNNKSQKLGKQDDKKQKDSLIKKLLIKNKIPRKLMKLAKKGNLAYKNMEQHTLLPKLTLKNLFPQIQDLNKKNQQHHEQFQVVNKQLTCSMLSFQHRFSQISQQDEGRILSMQTQKCYSHIPNYFFAQLSQQQIQVILTRNKNQAAEKAFDLADYSDEVIDFVNKVEYNINQQVGYKMKVFMDFAFFLQGIVGLVDISCKKIQGSRARNNIVRQIIVQKSININILRVKQSNLTSCIKILDQIKKVKHMQKSLMSLIHAKGKIAIGDIYEQYCKQHEQVKQFCCKRGLCSFGDLKYYVERNYQETFNRSLQNYLGEMTKMDKQKLVDILKPTKAIYISMPFQNKNTHEKRLGQKASYCLDQSMEVEDQFQLIIKTNIEKQISNIFELGLKKCTYSTDNLCLYLKEQLQQMQLKVYSSILENIQKPKEDILDNFVNYALNRPTQSSLQLNIDDKVLSFVQRSQILNKIALPKFLQIGEIISKKLMDLSVRCFSMVNKLMVIMKPLQRISPQKQQIISAYLLQLVIICVGFSNSCLGNYINLREIKQSEIQIGDKLINLCQEWQQFVQQVQVKYESLWRKLIFHLTDQTYRPKTKALRQKKTSFKQLQEFVNLNYSTKQMQELNESDNQDVSEQLIDRAQIKLKLLNQIIHAKNQKINFNFYALSKLIIGKQLVKRIQNQSWTAISMNSNIQNSAGFIIYGQKYLLRQQSHNNSRNFLSKSMILDKSNFMTKRKSEESMPPPPDEQFEIETTQKWIRIRDKTFKLVGVTEYILQVVYLFFVYFDKYSFEEQKSSLSLGQKQNFPQKSVKPIKINFNLLIEKTVEVIDILIGKMKHFVSNLKELQKKVKSFAKFLLLSYVQLDFLKTVMLSISNDQTDHKRFQSQISKKNNEKQLLEVRKTFTKQIDECMNEIVKKYNSIGYEKIKQSVKKMEVNPKKQIKTPSETTSQILAYFSRSLEVIQDIIIDKRQFWKFLNCPWIKIYLERLNEQYKQVRKFVMKSTGSGSGRRIQQIEWEDKLDWKTKELKWLLSAIQNENYTEHIKDISVLEEEFNKSKKNHADKK